MVWGAPQGWDQAVGRFQFLEGHGGPDAYSPEDVNNFNAYATFKSIVGRVPTGNELAASVAAGPAQASYITAIKAESDRKAAEAKADAAQAKADAESAAAKSATSSFLSGFSQYASLVDKGLTPADAAALISLDQTTKSNALALTAQTREVVGQTIGDTNNSSLPGPAGAAGATPAPIVGTTNPGHSPALYIGIVLVAVFFLLKKR